MISVEPEVYGVPTFIVIGANCVSKIYASNIAVLLTATFAKSPDT